MSLPSSFSSLRRCAHVVGALFRRRRIVITPRPRLCRRRPFQVDRIDDPEGLTRIVRVAGMVWGQDVVRICATWHDVPEQHLVHIDVADARLSAPAMNGLEHALEHLEQRRVRVRIVGLDPRHPMIAR